MREGETGTVEEAEFCKAVYTYILLSYDGLIVNYGLANFAN